MGKRSKLEEKILSGKSNANIRFADMCSLLEAKGFEKRVNSSHHIFTHDDLPNLVLNFQPDRNGKAKPYQVRQVRAILESNQ